MITYNHAYDIAFAIPHSISKGGEDITPIMFREAIIKRLKDLDDDELVEAIGMPFDSYEEG